MLRLKREELVCLSDAIDGVSHKPMSLLPGSSVLGALCGPLSENILYQARRVWFH
jgi:hypothetical protein